MVANNAQKPACWIDAQRYPLTRLEDEDTQVRLAQWRRQFHDEGVCVLDGFIGSEALAVFVEEANQLAPRGLHNTLTGNAYLEAIDLQLPADDPRRFTETTSLSAVAGDQIPDTACLKILYRWHALTETIRQIAGLPQLYFYDCPLGSLNISVMTHNDYLRWHFDQSDFVVSIPLQEAEAGGVFEFARNIRSDIDPHYDRVSQVLRGDRHLVQSLHATPGSLILFKGKHTLHRVTPIQGDRPRLYALLGYAEQPHVGGSDYLRMIRYGRTK